MDEPVINEAIAIAEAEHGAAGNETHAGRWSRPELKAFNLKEKAITFQVCFGHFPIFFRPATRLTLAIPDVSHTYRSCHCCRLTTFV